MVDIGETRLACRISGNPGGSPLVLLHALGKDGSDWDEVAEELDDRWRLYVPDLRGHGRSDWPGEYSFELMRADLGALLEALSLRQVTLVGHSMGGVVAYLYTARHPERVERLVLEETPPPFPRERPLPERPAGEPGFDWNVVGPLYAQLADPAEDWQSGLDTITTPTLLVRGAPAQPRSAGADRGDGPQDRRTAGHHPLRARDPLDAGVGLHGGTDRFPAGRVPRPGQPISAATSSAIWTALRAAPLRRLSPEQKRDRPCCPPVTVSSARMRPT